MGYNENDFNQPLTDYSNIKLHKGVYRSTSGATQTVMEIEGYYTETMLLLTKLRYKWTPWAVFNEIWRRKTKVMRIMPYNTAVNSLASTDTPDEAIKKLRELHNATAGPDSWKDSAPKGKEVLSCGGPNQTKQIGDLVGTGSGSDTVVSFTPQMWVPQDAKAAFGAANAMGPGVRKDEILFHEMVHGMRQMTGTSLCSAVPDTPGMDTLEEFVAIVISNVYRSELGLTGLREDHHAFKTLAPEQSTSQGFLDAKKDGPTSNLKRLKQLKAELPQLCNDLARVQANFNPFKLI